MLIYIVAGAHGSLYHFVKCQCTNIFNLNSIRQVNNKTYCIHLTNKEKIRQYGK